MTRRLPHFATVIAALVLLCAPAAAHAQTAFDGDGMWIWELPKSSGGNLDAIAAQAHANGIETLFVKSADGRSYWPQFSRQLVDGLHARGLRVCAWPFVYGNYPQAEAKLSARAIASGADCLVIDAEGQYEGKYTSASTYMRKLRKSIGPAYPLGLAGFPYVDYHPAFPYSVFLGPGGAQFNLPQMYWRAIGTTVDEVYAHTYAWNTLYGRPIFPLGQLYMNPPQAEVIRFRQLAAVYGATGLSWWSWQSAAPRGLGALAMPLESLAGVAPTAPTAPTAPAPTVRPTLTRGRRGDTVVWAQQHLGDVKLTGRFDAATKRSVRRLQLASGLPVTGAIDPATWGVLLARAPKPARWRTNPATARLKPLRREIASKR